MIIHIIRNSRTISPFIRRNPKDSQRYGSLLLVEAFLYERKTISHGIEIYV
jgi:hypothetical protein